VINAIIIYNVKKENLSSEQDEQDERKKTETDRQESCPGYSPKLLLSWE